MEIHKSLVRFGVCNNNKMRGKAMRGREKGSLLEKEIKRTAFSGVARRKRDSVSGGHWRDAKAKCLFRPPFIAPTMNGDRTNGIVGFLSWTLRGVIAAMECRNRGTSSWVSPGRPKATRKREAGGPCGKGLRGILLIPRGETIPCDRWTIMDATG